MNNNVTTLNWDMSFGERQNESDPELRFSRQQLQTLIQDTTKFCIDSVASEYKLTNRTTNSIYDNISQFETSLIAGGEGEYRKAPEESLSIGTIMKELGNVALMPNASFGDLFPREKIIFLSVNSAKEEARFLDSALKVVVPIYKENKLMVSPDTMNNLELLEDPREVMEKAIAVASARRLLKYGLVRNEDLPAGALEVGFDNWLDHCKEKQGRTTNYSRNDKTMLRNIYKKENMAIKNLRYTIWPSLFYSIIGIDPEQDPFLYVKYAQQVDDNSQYSVTFNYGGTTCRLEDKDIKNTLNNIFVPSDTKISAVPNNLKK